MTVRNNYIYMQKYGQLQKFIQSFKGKAVCKYPFVMIKSLSFTVHNIKLKITALGSKYSYVNSCILTGWVRAKDLICKYCSQVSQIHFLISHSPLKGSYMKNHFFIQCRFDIFDDLKKQFMRVKRTMPLRRSPQ